MIDLRELTNLLGREISQAETRVSRGFNRSIPGVKEDAITALFVLVQAKRRYRDGRWNRLTKTQCERLPQRMDYTALVRYEFADYGCQNLQAFSWHPLLGRNISDADQWLKRGDFPDAVATSAVVASLSSGEYGTDDLEIIEREICPDTGRCMIIEVDWADGEDPGALVEGVNWEVAGRAQRSEEAVRVRVRS